MPRGQQRQLVYRQRPAAYLGHDKRDAPHPPTLELIDEGPHHRDAARARERQRILERRPCARPGRQDQHPVIAQRVATGEQDPSRAGVNRRHPGLHELDAEVPRDLLKRNVAGLPDPKRLGDSHRPVDEVGLGRHERRLHPVAGQVTQRHHRFQRRNAAADDQHAGLIPTLSHEPKLCCRRLTVNEIRVRRAAARAALAVDFSAELRTRPNDPADANEREPDRQAIAKLLHLRPTSG